MKISVNDKIILELLDIQKKVIQNDISLDAFESDMSRRLHYINDHPCQQYIDRNSEKMRNKIKSKGARLVPSERMKFAEEYFKHDDENLGNESAELVVKIDGKESHRIGPVQKKLLKRAKGCDSVDCHCEEQMKWILMHKYERCMERLRRAWESKLATRYPSLPIDDREFAELVFAQPDYKSKQMREMESKSM